MKYLFTFLCLIFLCSSCSRQDESINVGYNDWIGYHNLIIAVKKGFFAKEGIDVKPHYFTTQIDVMRGFSEGNLNVILTTINEALLLADKGEKFKIVFILDYSNGSDAVIAHSNIKTIQDLKGKTISLETGSLSHYLLLKALHHGNLNEKDVKLINTSGDEAVDLFVNKSTDAMISWSPYTITAMKKGDGHILFSSKQIPGEIIDVIVIKQDFINEHPEQCKKFIDAYINSLNWFKNNKIDGFKIIGSVHRTSPEELQIALDGVHLTALKENIAAFSSPTDPGSIYSILHEYMLFLFNHQLIKKQLETNQLIDPQFIKQHVNQNVNSNKK